MHTLNHIDYKNFINCITEKSNLFLWYPRNLNFTISDDIKPLFERHINNLWNPNKEWYSKIHSRVFEQEVIAYRADKYGLKKENTFGYIWSSWTEWNMQWVYLAKKRYPNGELFFSADTHYSIQKIANIMSLPVHNIESDNTWVINYINLKSALLYYKESCNTLWKSCNPIIILNAGTTVTWAIDEPSIVCNLLEEIWINNYYIHIDAALTWGFLPFIENPEKPYINFNLPIHSISISWHKFIGCPIPAGIFISKKDDENIDVLQFSENHVYIGTNDNTIMWSRSGLSPILLYDQLQQRHSSFGHEINTWIELAHYLKDQINLHNPKYKARINPNSITVIFHKPSDFIVDKYQLACEQERAHIVVMQHVTKKLIDQFINDLINSD